MVSVGHAGAHPTETPQLLGEHRVEDAVPDRGHRPSSRELVELARHVSCSAGGGSVGLDSAGVASDPRQPTDDLPRSERCADDGDRQRGKRCLTEIRHGPHRGRAGVCRDDGEGGLLRSPKRTHDDVRGAADHGHELFRGVGVCDTAVWFRVEPTAELVSIHPPTRPTHRREVANERDDRVGHPPVPPRAPPSPSQRPRPRRRTPRVTRGRSGVDSIPEPWTDTHRTLPAAGGARRASQEARAVPATVLPNRASDDRRPGGARIPALDGAGRITAVSINSGSQLRTAVQCCHARCVLDGPSDWGARRGRCL